MNIKFVFPASVVVFLLIENGYIRILIGLNVLVILLIYFVLWISGKRNEESENGK